eukprot:gene3893-4855_t
MPSLLALDSSTDTMALALVTPGQTKVFEAAGGAQASARMLPEVKALLAGAGLIAWSAWHFTAGGRGEGTNDAFVQADFTLVAPKVSGFIGEVLVEDNQPVTAGQLLARIDDRDYRAALSGARAEV